MRRARTLARWRPGRLPAEALAKAGRESGSRDERAAARLRGARRAAIAARGLQRAAARGGARRFLVQPLQRIRRQGPDRHLRHRVRAGRHSSARAWASFAICSARRRRARRCCSIWTTGRASAPNARPSRPAQRRRATRPRGLNENYARELLELHTLGVDGGYTQQDIVEVARAFTGWTIDRPDGAGFRFAPDAARRRRQDGARPDDHAPAAA